MAVAIYTTDLTTLATGDSDVGGDAGTWDESSDAGWDDEGSMVDDQNLYYNHSECVSAQFTKDGIGTIMYEHTGSVTIPADGALLIHHLWAAPAALASLALGGVRIIIGNGFGVFYSWDCSGNDFTPAPRGGWANYALNPAIGSPDDTVGSPGTPYDTFGMAVSATQQARGNPNAVNAIRYGRCISQFTVGAEGTPATFAGFAAIDDTITNKWALLAAFEGSFKFQGLMSLGLAGTSVYFEDTNQNINIIDTINVTAAFNAIEIHHASSTIKWTNINITALGTTSKGTLEMVDNATFTDIGGVFTDMSTFVYDSNYTGTGRTWRRCGQITQGGGTFTNCIFDESVAAVALVADNIDDVTECTFNSSGTGHAVNLGTVAASDTMVWNNKESGYAIQAGTAANRTILVNVATDQTLTINISAGASTPTYYNTGAGTVSISNDLTLTITGLITGSDIVVYEADTTVVLDDAQENSGSTWGYLYPGGDSGDYIDIGVFLAGYRPYYIRTYLLSASNASVPVSQTIDRDYLD